MEKDSVIALDPINDELIRYSLNNGIKIFVEEIMQLVVC